MEQSSSDAPMGIHIQHYHHRFRNSVLRRALLDAHAHLSAAECLSTGVIATVMESGLDLMCAYTLTCG